MSDLCKTGLQLEIASLFKTSEYSHGELTINKITNTKFEIGIYQMYDAPVINFTTLKKLSDLLGTEEIDVNNYSQAGCETCDYGSSYGHEIQVYNPTKYVLELCQLDGSKFEYSSRK